MASLSKKANSPFFMGKFRDDSGRIVMRSTKQTERKKAQWVVDSWEESARKARRGELTRSTALKVLSELVERTTGELLIDATVSGYLNGWLESRMVKGRATATLARYRPIVAAFLKFMGDRAGKTIRGVTGSDLRRFRDAQVDAGKSAVTSNLFLNVIKAAFERAKREGIIDLNPATQVDALEGDGESRLPFSDVQIQQLLVVAPVEWKGMILLGAHTGLRMSDAAALTWENIDAKSQTVSFIPKKTRRTRRDSKITIALHTDVTNWLQGLRRKTKCTGAVFPTLVGRPTGSHTGLSNEFGALMKLAGIERVFGDTKEGKGRRATLLSFHSLRHSCVSRLANADVNADVRKTIAGHSTDEAHARYTHLELETQRRALEKLGTLLPTVTNQ